MCAFSFSAEASEEKVEEEEGSGGQRGRRTEAGPRGSVLCGAQREFNFKIGLIRLSLDAQFGLNASSAAMNDLAVAQSAEICSMSGISISCRTWLLKEPI